VRPTNDPNDEKLETTMRYLTLAPMAFLLAGGLASPAGAASPCATPTIQMVAGKTTYGTNGPDVIRGTAAGDIAGGAAGADVICGGRGPDDLYGGSGDDNLYGGPGADYLYDIEGSALLVGGGGHDRITASDLAGVPGADTVRGGAGDDTISAGDGVEDTIDCGDGQDNVEFDPGLDQVAANCEDTYPV
jgi:Ca2+-binding RTX toxin-like protein